MEELQKIAKYLFELVPLEPLENTPFCCHPFTNCTFTLLDNDFINLTDSEDDYSKWKNFVFNQIDRIRTANTLLAFINKPWRLYFCKMCFKANIDIKIVSELWGNAWIESENPNDDVNVSLDECILYFRKSDKKALMTKEELNVWMNLPAEITLYRGVSVGRNPQGLSYTRDLKKAEWFRDRWLKDNMKENVYIIKATVKKKDCLAYFNRRNEEEIVVDSFNILKKEII